MTSEKEAKSDRAVLAKADRIKTVDNPLAKIAGKFGGEFWQETQSEIKRLRKLDRDIIDRSLDTEAKPQE